MIPLSKSMTRLQSRAFRSLQRYMRVKLSLVKGYVPLPFQTECNRLDKLFLGTCNFDNQQRTCGRTLASCNNSGATGVHPFRRYRCSANAHFRVSKARLCCQLLDPTQSELGWGYFIICAPAFWTSRVACRFIDGPHRPSKEVTTNYLSPPHTNVHNHRYMWLQLNLLRFVGVFRFLACVEAKPRMGMETLPTVSSSKQGKGYVLCEMIMIQDISCDARQVANILLDANSKNKGISLNYPCQFERDLDAQV